MNKELINILEEFRHIAEILGQPYREKAYRKAIASIGRLDYKINENKLPNLKESKISGVGKGILEKIVEFIKTGRVLDLENLRADKTVKAYEIFSKILGVGPSTIDEFIKAGIFDLQGLRKAVANGTIELNNMQKIGLMYYNDLNERIPRQEVTSLCDVLYKMLNRLMPGIFFEISGSYRRGAQTSGDIDILLTHEVYAADLLIDFANIIKNDPSLVAVISMGRQRLTFLYKNPKVRQIDLLWIEPRQFPYASLYFCGNGNFNEYMRGLAKKKGYRLNQMGLFKITNKGQKLMKVKTEKEIFDILGMQYIEPKGREF
jgi:DNA polymerase/3'-5' exonuclease PolX